MKTTLTLITAVTLFIASPVVKAQAPESPASYKLDKEGDYTKYVQKFKDDIDWYIKSPFDKDTALRKEVAGFIVKWITGSPTVSISLGSVATAFVDDQKFPYNGEMLIAYMAGAAIYEIDHPNDKDEANIEQAGVEEVLAMANAHADLFKKSKAVKKYQGMADGGKLLAYVKDCIKKDQKSK